MTTGARSSPRRVWGARRLLILVAVLIALAILILLATAAPLWPPAALAAAAGTRIVFDADRGVGTSEIYRMDADGSNLTRLTTNTTHEYNAAISPDGTRIAFESNRTGVYQIYVMDADGANEQRVTYSGVWEQFPHWSPDGTKLVFARVVQYPSVSRVCVVNVDGTDGHQLSGGTDNDWAPDWSPDGTKIAFFCYVSGRAGIWVMNPDGSGRQQIAGSNRDQTAPHWSPGGTRLVYSATDSDWTPACIHVVNADGTEDVALTDSTYDNYNPAWSPDGSRIVFQSNRTGIQQIYSMNADGTDLQRLTSSPYASGDWSPHWGLDPGVVAVGDPPAPGLTLGVTNPVRVSATIRFTMPRPGAASLQIVDSAGRLVRILLQQRLAAGAHFATWDGRDDAGRPVPAGVYHCRLASGGATRSAKLVLVR